MVSQGFSTSGLLRTAQEAPDSSHHADAVTVLSGDHARDAAVADRADLPDLLAPVATVITPDPYAVSALPAAIRYMARVCVLGVRH